MTDGDRAALLPAGCRLISEPPRSEVHVRLHRLVGLSLPAPEQAAGALVNSWAWTTISTEPRDAPAEVRGLPHRPGTRARLPILER